MKLCIKHFLCRCLVENNQRVSSHKNENSVINYPHVVPSLWRVRELSDFIRNILIYVLKMNKGLMGLERHEGE